MMKGDYSKVYAGFVFFDQQFIVDFPDCDNVGNITIYVDIMGE